MLSPKDTWRMQPSYLTQWGNMLDRLGAFFKVLISGLTVVSS